MLRKYRFLSDHNKRGTLGVIYYHTHLKSNAPEITILKRLAYVIN